MADNEIIMGDTRSTDAAAEAGLNIGRVLRALRHRNYRLFLGGQLISLIGSWMQTVAQSWLVYRLTGSSMLLGLVGFAGQIPVFILSPAGGAVADRANRQRVVIAAQAVMMVLALLLAGLTLAGVVRLWHIFVLAVLLGVANAFDIPARQAFLVEMVGKTDLMNAIALNSSMFNGARIVGPAVAGVLVAAIGEGWCFFANGISYVAVIAGLLMMRLEPRPAPASRKSPLADVVEGFLFVIRTGPVHALLILLGVMSLAAMPYVVLMPIFADRVLNGGPQGLGLLLTASGVGALAGALLVAARHGVKGLGKWVAAASAGFGVSLILFGLSRSFWLSALLLLPVGFSLMVQMASSNTLIQTMVPDELRGRVMSVYSMMFIGMAPFGALLAGALAERIGAPATVMAGGTVSLLGAIVFRLRWPALRAQARELIVAQQAGGGEPVEQTSGGTSAEIPRDSFAPRE